ncbi:MAG: hypothetical protein LBJ08_04845 [Bifidobacteriaceae bacterium]|jgi:hypothetical protein|nr:hypothetical protein [Bifidobacteriaceae bacterium]
MGVVLSHMFNLRARQFSATGARVVAVASVAFATVFLIGGCANSQHGDVPTLTDESSRSVEAGLALEALVACLKDAEIPARVGSVDGNGVLSWEERHDIYAVNPWGETVEISGLTLGDAQSTSSGEFANFVDSHFADGLYSAGLKVDGVDFSDDYGRCLDSSGYQPSEREIDVASELAAKQALAEITNDWIACARDNGYSDWPDVEPGKADGWLTSPTALVPLSISTDSLQELLGTCPNFDEDTARRLEVGDGGSESDFLAQPSVAISPPDPPVFDEGTGGLVPIDDENHYQELVEVLGQAETDFYSSRASEAESDDEQ